MVAYSFKARFIHGIETGLKRQTIRADRKRHARPGEEVQLYTAMRTRHCRLIGKAICQSVEPIILLFTPSRKDDIVTVSGIPMNSLNDFARRDGFASWTHLRAFWTVEHPGTNEFHGVLITWGSLL